MSQLMKSGEETDFVLSINEHDIEESLGKFAKSMSKEEIARFNKIYAQREADSTKALLKEMPKTDVNKSKQI